MDIITMTRNGCFIIKVMGEIDHHSAEMVRDRFEKEFPRSRCKHLVFDFSGVGFMDSSGIGMIIGRYKELDKNGGKVAIANMNRELKRLYEISGLHKIVASYESLDEAERDMGNGK